MSLLADIDWNACTNLLLQAMQAGQHGLLQVLAVLGLTHDVDGQPGWPFATRLSGEVLLIDRSVVRSLLTALASSAAGVLLVVLALAWRRGRWPLLAGAIALFCYVPWPDQALLAAPATPASFHVSPTAFSAASIVRGQALYTQQCTACHGANGKGDTPLGLSLSTAPPNLAGPLLWRRADGDLLWHIRHGKGAMPAFEQLSAADAWALVDYMKANAAGTSLRDTGLWQQPIALPSLPVRCAAQAATATPQWRGQRIRLVLPDAAGALPLEDPRLNSVLVGAASTAPPVAGQPAIDCVDDDRQSLLALAVITGQAPTRMAGTQLIADRDGWLRARKSPSDAASWSDADMLCRSPLASADKNSETAGKSGSGVAGVQQGLDGLIAAMDAEPVRFVKGGFIH